MVIIRQGFFEHLDGAGAERVVTRPAAVRFVEAVEAGDDFGIIARAQLLILASDHAVNGHSHAVILAVDPGATTLAQADGNRSYRALAIVVIH